MTSPRPHIIVHGDYALLSWTDAAGKRTAEVTTPADAIARAKQMEQEA